MCHQTLPESVVYTAKPTNEPTNQENTTKLKKRGKREGIEGGNEHE